MGPLLTKVTDSCFKGNRFYRVKILLPLDKPLKDKIQVKHPTLGVFIAYIVYERLQRICLFCSKIGHDHTTCVDKVRVQRLMLDPKYKDIPGMNDITCKKVRPWINNQAFLLALGPPTRKTNQNATPAQPEVGI